MPPKTETYRRIRQRMRRTLNYGPKRMDTLTLPLSEMVVDYFDRCAPFDYLNLDFATRLSRDGCVDACTMLVAMVYIDRVRGMDRCFFEESDASELYLSALVVASKYLQDGGLDEFVYNDEWGVAASTSTKRVNELEVHLLNALTWNANVSESEFERSLESCERWIARHALRRNGFCTYNEVTALAQKTPLEEWRKLLETLAFACFACAAVYVASVVSVYTAVHVARTPAPPAFQSPPLLLPGENSTTPASPDDLDLLARSLLPPTPPDASCCLPLYDLVLRENATSLQDQRVVLRRHLHVPIALLSN
ncbi:hypothetical protein QR680_005733 [Steinernema hermaphroditum]|uniref:Protein CNPPD1 n=1 Tax=Steinernema hermaphroditum TaxID=289476 RepID=A0AA39HT55_9BILA|nr:hypothetical protein QR680_005733 [Steinernema hermaphroditum]